MPLNELPDPARIFLQPNETVGVDFDFTLMLPDSATIDSSSATATGGISLGARVVTGAVVQQTITTPATGWVEGKVTVRIVSGTWIRELDLYVAVRDQ